MNLDTPMIISLCILPILGMLLSLGFAFGLAKTSHKDYSPLRHFPFEATKGKENAKLSRVFFILLVLFALIASSIPLLLNMIPDFRHLFGTSVFGTVVTLLAGIALTLLVFFDPEEGKPHMIAVTFASSLTCLSLLEMGFNLFQLRLAYEPVICYIAMGFETLLSITILFLLLSPRMASWAKMEVTMNQDGTTEKRRPRFFPLAFLEWGLYFGLALGAILYALTFLLATLSIIA